MTAVERARGPIRVPSWPAAAAEEPDFAAIRTEFGVPEDFPADVLAEAEQRARALSSPSSTPPTSPS